MADINKKRQVVKIRNIVLLFIAGFIILGLYNEIQITRYKIKSEKIKSSIRIALVADLHSCKYKQNQQEIFNLIKKEQVDLILMPGDIIDDDLPMETGYKTVKYFAHLAPTFYVSGNHEFWSGCQLEIKETLKDFGIVCLEGDVIDITIKDEVISIYGIDDPFVGEEIYKTQLASLKKIRKDNLSLLLAHRPERIQDYNELDVDLVFSGHAHGGQWRIPFFLENGLFAPNQGFLPKYTKGIHNIGKNQKLVITRGLNRESTRIPRFYNRPELVILDIESK